MNQTRKNNTYQYITAGPRTPTKLAKYGPLIGLLTVVAVGGGLAAYYTNNN